MGTNNSFKENAVSCFDTIMKKKFVEKTDLLSLKQKLKVLKDTGECNNLFNEGNNILNKITRIANSAKGKSSVEILRKVYDDFTQLCTLE
ncbi:MAG: hypothetical protein WC875_00710 [Candidatus Absconditabacterales bacterium]|jgi:hypothetical protein